MGKDKKDPYKEIADSLDIEPDNIELGRQFIEGEGAKADNDEIRGVDTVCFGDCTPTGCQETSVVTHDTRWFEPECVEGGIIRPKATYTNQEYSYRVNIMG